MIFVKSVHIWVALFISVYHSITEFCSNRPVKVGAIHSYTRCNMHLAISSKVLDYSRCVPSVDGVVFISLSISYPVADCGCQCLKASPPNPLVASQVLETYHLQAAAMCIRSRFCTKGWVRFTTIHISIIAVDP